MTAASRADEITMNLVSICASTHFGDLRDDMVLDSAMKTFIGDLQTPTAIRLAVAVGVITRLSTTISALADEISGKAQS